MWAAEPLGQDVIHAELKLARDLEKFPPRPMRNDKLHIDNVIIEDL